MLKLLHGDYRTVIQERAHLIVTSPPYNIGSKSEAKVGRRRVGGYDAKSYRSIREYPDDLPENEYQDQQLAFLYWCYDHLYKGGVLVYNHKPRRRNGRMTHPMQWILKCEALTLMEEVVWDRGSTHNHGRKLFWPTTERLYVFRRSGENYPLDNYRDKGLLFRSDVWKIPPDNKVRHNAPFPAKLAEQCVLAFTNKGQTVMDPFAGSGTVAVAAQRLKRHFIGAEILKKYHRQATKRISSDRST